MSTRARGAAAVAVVVLVLLILWVVAAQAQAPGGAIPLPTSREAFDWAGVLAFLMATAKFLRELVRRPAHRQIDTQVVEIAQASRDTMNRVVLLAEHNLTITQGLVQAFGDMGKAVLEQRVTFTEFAGRMKGIADSLERHQESVEDPTREISISVGNLELQIENVLKRLDDFPRAIAAAIHPPRNSR